MCLPGSGRIRGKRLSHEHNLQIRCTRQASANRLPTVHTILLTFAYPGGLSFGISCEPCTVVLVDTMQPSEGYTHLYITGQATPPRSGRRVGSIELIGYSPKAASRFLHTGTLSLLQMRMTRCEQIATVSSRSEREQCPSICLGLSACPPRREFGYRRYYIG